MTEFSIQVETILDIDSCEHILAINRWIKESVVKAGIECDKYTFRASFFMGELHVDCDNEDEFKEHAFGQEISMYEYYLTGYTTGGVRIGFGVGGKRRNEKNLSIHCNDKHILADLVSALRVSKESYDREHTTVQNVSINVEHSQVGAITVGDNNHVQTSVECDVPVQDEPVEEAATFWQGVWQTIVSNSLWVVIASGILLFLAYLGIVKPEWLVF